MTDQAFAQADPDWVKLISLARECSMARSAS